MRLVKWMVCAVGGILLVFAASMAAQSVRPQPEPDVLGALLVEVRGLRQAMERMASAGPQVQLSLGRLQLQEQRINAMLRRLDSVHDALGQHGQAVAKLEKEIAGGEEALRTADTKSPEERKMLESVVPFELRQMKQRLSLAAIELQRFQSEEALLQQQIANEQARWSDINRTLEELERTLGKR